MRKYIICTFLLLVVSTLGHAKIINVDGNINDWQGIPYTILDPQGDNPSYANDMIGLKITNDPSKIYFLYTFNGPSVTADVPSFLLIDSDMNANTGYTGVGGIGMEFGITFTQNWGSYIGDSRDGNWSNTDFPNALTTVIGSNFIEASAPIGTFKTLTPDFKGFDVSAHNDFSDIGRYLLNTTGTPLSQIINTATLPSTDTINNLYNNYINNKPVPHNDLEMFVSGKFIPTNTIDFDNNKPTVIIMHGWNPDGSQNLDEVEWMNNMGAGIADRYSDSGGVNILAWDWLDRAHGQLIDPVPNQKVPDEAINLSRELRLLFGDDYIDKGIQLIGNSLGSGIATRAAIYLQDLEYQVSRLTLLDGPVQPTADVKLDRLLGRRHKPKCFS